jgi:hypothetical protein
MRNFSLSGHAVLPCVPYSCPAQGGPRKNVSDTMSKNLNQAQGPPPLPVSKKVSYAHILDLNVDFITFGPSAVKVWPDSAQFGGCCQY